MKKAIIISQEKAVELGMSKPNSDVGGRGALKDIILSASGKKGSNKADKINIHNLKTGESQRLLYKGKKIKFTGFKK